ncbi:MAG: hypothetical protein U9N81_15145 [Bacillota bacterium]|nr:hypothetical protein [Bacillota bacterium]
MVLQHTEPKLLMPAEQMYPPVKGRYGDLIFVTYFLDAAGVGVIIPQNSENEKNTV